MKLLVLFSALVASASASLRGYSLPAPDGPPHTEGGCKDGEILHVDGTCIVPEISRRMFVFDAPQDLQSGGPPAEVPPPQVHHNIVFVRIPGRGEGSGPIVVPPPRQRNIVYVLNKQSGRGQEVIEVPSAPPSKPEVYFVSYDEDAPPTLPDGLDFHAALSSAVQGEGQLITSAGAAGGDEGGYSASSETSAGFDGHVQAGSDLTGGSGDPSGATAVHQDFFSDGGVGGEAAADAPELEAAAAAAGAHTGGFFPLPGVSPAEPTGLYIPP